MEQNNFKKTIEEKITEAIKRGSIKMRPKWHFILKTALAIVGGIILFFAILYLASFMLFMARQSGILSAPAFGLSGWFVLLKSLPWMLILLSVLFVVILETLVKKYSFAHRKPLLYSVLAISVLAILGGIMLAPVHKPFFKSAQENRLPSPAGRFYRDFGPRPFNDFREGVIGGTVVSLGENEVIIKDARGATSTVFFSPEADFIFEENLEEGDKIIIFGRREGNEIIARGIKIIE
jgi:hypothetical protein